MNAAEFLKGWERSIASEQENLSEEDSRLLKLFGKHLTAAANYRSGSEFPAPQPSRTAAVAEFPKALGKLGPNGEVSAVFKAWSVDTQPSETHNSPWMPLRNLAEYDRLIAEGVPEWSPGESMTERDRRLQETRLENMPESQRRMRQPVSQ